jgi:hypothetical protein
MNRYEKIVNEWLDRNRVNQHYDEIAQYVRAQLGTEAHSLYYVNDLRWLDRFLPNDKNGLIVIVFPFELDQDPAHQFSVPFQPAGQRVPIGIQHLTRIKNLFPDREFLVIQSSPDFQSTDRHMYFIHGGNQILVQRDQYPQVDPIKEKKLHADYHAVFLSNQPKNHRVLAASYLLGHNLLSTVMIRGTAYTWEHTDTWWQVAGYDQDPKHVDSHLLQTGFELYKQGRHGGQPDGLVMSGDRTADNAWNFDCNLRYIYQSSLVELIPETVFVPQYRLITEKYLHTIYGFNIPIWLAARSTVAHVRELGFDVFDDYVNHDYDTQFDPMLRITHAIDSNMRLLSDRTYALQVWHNLLPRMQKNLDHARQNLYNQSMDRFKSDFDKFLTRRKHAESIV